MRSISGASRHYREDMPSAGHLDLADLHSLAHPGVRSGLPGFGGHRGDRSIDAMQQGLAAMLPQTGAMRNPGFGASSHFLGASASSPDDNGYSAQNPTPHHPADYMMRGKPSHNPYYRGLSSHGHGSPPGDSSPGLTQQQIVSNCKRKWLSPPGAHEDALTELARENLLLKHQLNLASQEVDRLKHVLEAYDLNQEEGRSSSSKGQSRYWTEEEHQRFLDAIQNYGHKDVKAIASVVGTRSATQVRTHAQKYFIKLARSRKQNQNSGLPNSSDVTSNPDRDDMAEDTGEEIADKSLEAAAAAAAAAGQAGTSAAAAAAFVAATHSKQSSQHSKMGSRHELRVEHTSSTAKPLEPLVSSNLELVSSVNTGVSNLERKSSKGASRHRKRSSSAKDGNGNNPGSPGSMGSSGSIGSSDATSNGNGSNGSNGVRSSDTTNGNGSSNGSNSNGHSHEGTSSGDSGSGAGVDSNNGVSSNEGSDHGFFDTAGEDGGNFSDELDGTGGGSEEGYLDRGALP